MTTITAPLTTITLQGRTPDVVRSCIVQQPSPPPDPGETPPGPITGPGIYTPVAPGVTYGSLPTVSIVDTSPDQMIGCIIDTAENPQGRLNALFPSAVNGDGVIERSTNDIWVFDGATWSNVGPTPGPTIVTAQVVPPWNEIVVYDARVRTRLEINGLAYALELLTEPAAYGITLGLAVQTSQALVRVPAADQSVVVELPAVSSGGSVQIPAAGLATAAIAPSVSSGGSAIVPPTSVSFAAEQVPYAGPTATVIQAVTGSAGTLSAQAPAVASGVSIAVPAADFVTAASVPIVSTAVPPVLSTAGGATAGVAGIYPSFQNVLADDILLLVVETSGADSNVSPDPGEPGWNILTGTPLFDGNSTPSFGSKLQVWWYRATAPISYGIVSFADSGDHQVGRVYLIRGCATTGDPFDVIGTATKPTPSTSASAPSVTTTAPQTLVVSIVSQPADGTTPQFGAPSNTGLTSLTDVDEVATNSANGGGFVIASGIKRLPGATGTINYSTTLSLSNASVVIAFKP